MSDEEARISVQGKNQIFRATKIIRPVRFSTGTSERLQILKANGLDGSRALRNGKDFLRDDFEFYMAFSPDRSPWVLRNLEEFRKRWREAKGYIIDITHYLQSYVAKNYLVVESDAEIFIGRMVIRGTEYKSALRCTSVIENSGGDSDAVDG